MTKLLTVILCLLALEAGAAAPSLSVTPSRTSGIAPLCVFFDATGTTDADTSTPFHDLLHTANFGDSAAGNWAQGSGATRSKNFHSGGPLAAHCYETAGTYTWKWQVSDGTTVASTSGTITVTDTWTTTFCFSTAGTFTDCPSIPGTYADSAACVTAGKCLTTSDFDDAINTNLATNAQLLFRAGETFTTSASSVLDVDGPWKIGKFGTGSVANVSLGAHDTVFNIGAVSPTGINDGRIMDLAIDGNSRATSNAFLGVGDFDQLTILRVSATNVHNGISLPAQAAALTTLWDQLSIVDSSFTNILGGSGGVGIFGSASKLALMGTVVNDASAAEHCVRFMYLQKAVITNNYFTTPAASKSALALRAPDWATGLGVIAANSYSRYVIVSDNKISGGTGVQVPFQIGGDGAEDSRNRDHIAERNVIYLPVGATPLTGIMVFSSDATGPVTVRNNIINHTGSVTEGQTGVKVAVNGSVPVPTGVNVINNTVYSDDAATTYRGIWVDTGAVSAVVKNNLAYAPNAATAYGLLDSGTTTTATTNSSDLQADSTNPFLATPSVSSLITFQPSTAYADDGGTASFPATGLLGDFFGCHNKAGAVRIGAVVPRASAICTGAP